MRETSAQIQQAFGQKSLRCDLDEVFSVHLHGFRRERSTARARIAKRAPRPEPAGVTVGLQRDHGGARAAWLLGGTFYCAREISFRTKFIHRDERQKEIGV